METYVLHAEPRELLGKKVKQLRRSGSVPVVLYGHHVATTPLSVNRGEMEKVYRKAGGSSVITLKVGSKDTSILVHDLQQDPVTGVFLHADFYQVRMDEKIKATIPLVFEGTAPAVRELDGILVTNISEVEVECLPGDLPHELTVAIDGLATFEDSISVADIPVPTGVTILTDNEMNVAAVSAPRTQEEVDEAAEAPEELDADAVPEDGEEADSEGEGGEGDKPEE